MNDTYGVTNPTIYNLIEKTGRPRRGRSNSDSIVKGLTPVPFRNEVGLRVISPEELLSLRVPVLHRETGALKGYQRPLKMVHAAKIASSIEEGKAIPAIEISLDELGEEAYITDGQHRVVGSIIARRPIAAVVTQRTYAQAHQLFADQALAKKPTTDHLVLTGTDRMAKYVQDALTNTTHPWHKMVHETNKSKLSPSTMHRLITMYGCDAIGTLTTDMVRNVSSRFDPSRADELADLIGVFGKDSKGEFSKKNNPLAFQRTNLSSLVQAAVYIFIRADDVKPKEDRDRWMSHMVDFNWVKFSYIREVKGMTEELLTHWNKKKTARRVERRIYHRYK